MLSGFHVANLSAVNPRLGLTNIPLLVFIMVSIEQDYDKMPHAEDTCV